MCVHALHTVHALPDLRVAAGRLRTGFYRASSPGLRFILLGRLVIINVPKAMFFWNLIERKATVLAAPPGQQQFFHKAFRVTPELPPRE
jgi:hypothetical protein